MQGIELLSIDLSNYCTKQCDFCYNHSSRQGNVKWTPQEVIGFAKDCIAHGVKAVSLGGGEPFEYDGVFEIIRELQPIVYLSVTSNGLPLENEDVRKLLLASPPDKIHITIHQADDELEVDRVLRQIAWLADTGIKPGVNLLVPASKIEFCTRAYQRVSKQLKPDQIILVPQRFSDSPTPRQLAEVAGGQPFQSPSCLLKCVPPQNFCSVSWDKRVNFCSYAGGKQPLTTLDFAGLTAALERVRFSSCCKESSEER